MRLVFLGPPGSGKGTYASRISMVTGWPQISTGDLLREAVKKGTDIGRTAESYMNEGKLVPDEIVLKLLKERLSQSDCKSGFILDGFPRSIEQATKLEGVTGVDLVVNLTISDEGVIQRLSTRRVCRKCGTIYNIRNVKPKVEGVCDKCSGELYQRDDDKPETIRKRLKVYEDLTRPLIEYYEKKRILVDIVTKDPDLPPEVTVEKIIKELKKC